jgi:hypothetical protein
LVKKKVDGGMQVRHSASQTQEKTGEAQTLEHPSLSNEDSALHPSIVESRGVGKVVSLTRPGRRQLAAGAVASDWRDPTTSPI